MGVKSFAKETDTRHDASRNWHLSIIDGLLFLRVTRYCLVYCVSLSLARIKSQCRLTADASDRFHMP